MKTVSVVSLSFLLLVVTTTTTTTTTTTKTIASTAVAATTTTTESSDGLMQCQRIAAVECQGLGYNMTTMPNLAGHNNQLDAELRLEKLLPIIKSGCSTAARFLLCSSLFPLCTPQVPRPIAACRSLCDRVRSDCFGHPELKQLWPDFLNCDALPQPEERKLCMQRPQDILKQDEKNAQEQEQSEVRQTLASSPTTTSKQQLLWPWNSWRGPAHLFRPTALVPMCPQNFTLNLLNSNECLPQCNRDAFYSTLQKKNAESLIFSLSTVCFVLTLFSMVTFWAEPTRFGYPERPVLFLCLCYNLFSVCYLERIVFHNSLRIPATSETNHLFGKSKFSMPCGLSPPCLASYITTSYLSLCAATWWLILTICFFLSSHKKWSSEALEKKSGLFHVLAWVPPLVPPTAALLLDRVRPNELTGMCLAPGFVEVPTMIFLILGFFFTIRASHSLLALQQQMQQVVGNRRFSQIRKRFMVFSLFYCLPTATGIVATLLERHVAVVPACLRENEDDDNEEEECLLSQAVNPWPTTMRIFFQLLGGTLTGMWVWSRKTCESYRNRIVATSNSATSIKSASASPNKYLHTAGNGKATSVGGPLYSGINFHNVPVYSPNQSLV